jgi:site-specific DNA-methyltransferase (adenine-specific)
VSVEIVHADSLAWIADKDPRDWALLFIDPPYGIDYSAGNVRGVKFVGTRIQNDLDTTVRDSILDWWGAGAAVVFGSWKVPHYGDPRGRLIWDKGLGTGMGDLSFPWKPCTEDIMIYGPGWHGHRGSCVIAVQPFQGSLGDHSNQKPIPLLQAILDKAPPGRVLDLTAGSGSTAVACSRLGRDCTVVEIDERWIPTIHRRVATEGAQMPLFA